MKKNKELTEGKTAFGASSPAYPALQVCEPRSITMAETSSAKTNTKTEELIKLSDVSACKLKTEH